MASVGGLANLLRILFVLICYIFSIVKRDEIILNGIFEYDLGKHRRFFSNGKKMTSFIDKFKNKNEENKPEKEDTYKQNTQQHQGDKMVKSSVKSRRMSIAELMSLDMPGKF